MAPGIRRGCNACCSGSLTDYSPPVTGSIRTTLLLLVALPVCSGAQTLVSPNDPIYGHLRVWEQRGLVKWLPPIRPLPAPIVRDALQEAAGSEHDTDRRIAERLLNRYFGPRPWQVEGRVTARSKAVQAGTTQPAANADSRIPIVPGLHAGVKMPIGDHFGFGVSARSLPTAPPGRPAPADRITPRYVYDPDDPYDPIAPNDGITLLGQAYHVDPGRHGIRRSAGPARSAGRLVRAGRLRAKLLRLRGRQHHRVLVRPTFRLPFGRVSRPVADLFGAVPGLGRRLRMQQGRWGRLRHPRHALLPARAGRRAERPSQQIPDGPVAQLLSGGLARVDGASVGDVRRPAVADVPLAGASQPVPADLSERLRQLP